MNDVKEETKEIFDQTPEYWNKRATRYLAISFIAIGIVMIIDFFIRVWWLDLALYLIAFISFNKSLYSIYCYGQIKLMTSWDKLVFNYEDGQQEEHTTYLLSEKQIDNYIPCQVYFLTNPDGEIILDENNEMLVFSDLDKAKDFGKKLKEDSRVMLLHLNTGEASE